MLDTYHHELQVVARAVECAAKISQSVLSAEDKGTLEKDDLSPVTVADFAVQALLAASIKRAFPDDKFVGEESAAELRANPDLLSRVWSYLLVLKTDTANEMGRNSQVSPVIPESPEHVCQLIDDCGSGEPGGEHSDKRVWVIDPIDGTRTFVQREAYAINVALLDKGKQVLGIVGCPTLPVPTALSGPWHNKTLDSTREGMIALAAKGQGTWVRPLVTSGPDENIAYHRIEPLSEYLTLADLRPVSCYHMLDSGVDDAHEAIHARLGINDKGCDFLAWVLRWVCLGVNKANMTVWVYKKRERTGKVWDHAGAMLLFEELGGRITDIDGKDIDLSVGRMMTANHGFVAAPRHLHGAVLEAVHDVLREQEKGHLLAQE